MRRVRDVTEQNVASISSAVGDLKRAVRKLRLAGAMKAADKARSALKSTEGAERHARGLIYRKIVRDAAHNFHGETSNG